MADHEHLTVKQVEKAIKESKGFLSIAAEKLGCTYQTVSNYINRHSTLRDVMDAINERHVDLSENKLISQINEGNITAIIFHLRCKGKKRGYVEKSEVEHTGPGGGPIQVEQKYSDWTDEELEQYADTGIKPERFR